MELDLNVSKIMCPLCNTVHAIKLFEINNFIVYLVFLLAYKKKKKTYPLSL